MVRPEYKEHVRSQSDFFDANPGRRAFAGKVLVDPDRYNEVYHYRHVPPRPSGLKEGADPDYDMDIIPDDQLASTKPVAQSKLSRRLFQEDDADDFVGVEFSAGNHSSAASRKSQELTTICSQELRGNFTGKDLQALSAKATQLIVERSIREGFDAQSHFVKSTSSPNPHTVKSTSPTKYGCDKDCLGYKTRRICSHVVAVAYYKNNLKQFLHCFKSELSKQPRNLTAITTFGVNGNAGRKRPVASRVRHKSPDACASMTTREQSGEGTIGELFTRDTTEYQAETSSNPLRITLRRTRPTKPTATPTTSTSFQLITISGKIR